MNTNTQDPIFIDIEASGLYLGSYPIEIGYGASKESITALLIDPSTVPDWKHWDQEAERVHGLSRKQLREQGLSPSLVAGVINNSLAGLTVYSNAPSFDWTWFMTLFDAANIQPSFRLRSHLDLYDDYLQALAINTPLEGIELKWKQLNDTAWQQVGPERRHRVNADVEQLIRLHQLVKANALCN